MFAEYNYAYIPVPLFAIQSPYDTWSLPNILGLDCENGGSLAGCQKAGVMDVIENYHESTFKVLKAIVNKSKSDNGFWAPSCANHCYVFGSSFYDSNYRIPANSEYSLSKSIGNWIQKVPGDNAHFDAGNWPTNSPCSGVSEPMFNL